MSKHLTPMEVVEHMIGRPEVIGRAINVDLKTPYNWRKASKNRAAGDIPSAAIMRRLMAYASARGLPLREDHLIWGAAEVEVLELMAARADLVRADLVRAAE